MNRIIAITGPSGAGKTTLGLSLLERGMIVRQTTTRNKRIDDDENNFRYLSHEEFKTLANGGKFLFWSGDSSEIEKGNGNFYGILKEDFEDALKKNTNIIMYVSYKDIDALVELKKRMMIDVITLTFKNFEKIRDRISDRSSDVDARIKCATKYEKEFGEKVRCASTVYLQTDRISIKNVRRKVYKTLHLDEKYYYIGFNANNSICNENFFDGSFTLYPNGEEGNICFKEKIECCDEKNLHQEYKKFVLSKKTRDMKFYAFNEEVKKLFKGKIKFENKSNEKITNYLNDKFKLKEDIKNLVPVLDFEIKKGNEITADEKIVVQEKVGSGGSNTFLIEKDEDLNLLKHDTEYSVSKYFKSNPINTTMIVSKDEIMLLSKSMQLIKLTDNKFKYVGADFEFTNHLDDETVKKICEISFKVSKYARVLGYRGILGIDLMQNGSEVYFTEVNPRFQSSSFLISMELKKYNLSIAHLYDAALKGRKLPEIEEVVLNKSFLNCNDREDFEAINPDSKVLCGYFKENKKSYYRKIFNRSICNEIDVEKV